VTSRETVELVAIVGTKGAFTRLTDALAAFAQAHPEARLWIQHGEGPLPDGPPNLEGAPLIARERLLARMARADAVICHAGSGTIRDAMSLGHRPIVVPRRAHLGEHVNDHQLELVQALGDRIIALPDPTVATLAAALTEARATRGEGRTDQGTGLKQALADDLTTLTAASSPRPRLARVLALATCWVPRRPHRWRAP
jgi:UDP-N-acetylglucosamine transferase subunit ALG13